MTRKRKSDNDLVVSAAGGPVPTRSRKPAARSRAKRPAEPITALAPATPETEVAVPQADSTAYTPSYEEIAALAYSYWEARGYEGGCPEEDWLRAEGELRVRTSVAGA